MIKNRMFLFSIIFVVGFLSMTLASSDSSDSEVSSYGYHEGSKWIRAKRQMCGGCCGGGSCCGMNNPCASSCCSQIPISITPVCPSCGGGCPCTGTPGCSCSQASLVIPVQTCCKCCQPVCANACIQG